MSGTINCSRTFGELQAVGGDCKSHHRFPPRYKLTRLSYSAEQKLKALGYSKEAAEHSVECNKAATKRHMELNDDGKPYEQIHFRHSDISSQIGFCTKKISLQRRKNIKD